MKIPDMEEKKYTLIINYPNLAAGGIETYLAALMRYYLKEGHRVIWITTTKHKRRIMFKGLTEESGLEITIWEKGSRYLSIPRIRFQEDERVIMLSCRAMQYVVGEGLKRRAKTREFKHFYTVAHFTGDSYYPDSCMKTVLGKQIVYRYWQKILKRMIANDCLMGFSEVHLNSYEAYYHVPISGKMERLVPIIDSDPVYFDERNTATREQERQERFVITTCGRLVFPHKAYILGLVDSYCRLKEKYPQIMLQIIGDGSGQEELKARVSGLPQSLRQDIILIGAVSPDELEDYYKKSHVIVGLAGAIINGAWSGIPSIVVRHYCDVCEAYGFVEDAFYQTLSEEKGEEITPLLERCITMSPEEYLRHGRAGFDRVQEDYAAMSDEPSYCYFEQSGLENTVIVRNLLDRVMGRILYVIVELKNRFKS